MVEKKKLNGRTLSRVGWKSKGQGGNLTGAGKNTEGEGRTGKKGMGKKKGDVSRPDGIYGKFLTGPLAKQPAPGGTAIVPRRALRRVRWGSRLL